MFVFSRSSSYSFGDHSYNVRFIVLYIFCSIALYTGDLRGWLPSDFLNRTAAEMQHKLSSQIVETTETWNSWRAWLESWHDVKRKNSALREQISTMEEWRIEAIRLRVENRDLLHILGLEGADNPSISFIGYGRVVAYGSREYPYSFVIALSDSDLDVPFDSVILQGEGLAGRVVGGGDGWLRVLHVSDASSRVPVETLRSGDRAILIGNNNSRPHLGFVGASHQIQDNDLLVTTGHGGVFTAGLPVGRVKTNSEGGFEVILNAPYHTMGWVRVMPALESFRDY